MHATLICNALEHRRLLRFHYKDHPTPIVVEPYTYGENSAGHMVLSAWLVSGETHDARPPLWRLYLDEEMRKVEVLEKEFRSNRPGYQPADSRFRVVHCRAATPKP